jgi:small basic protein (TIGR04137 family)
MSIDKSLRRKNTLARTRNVLTRGERILQMKREEKWPEGRDPFGLPKTKVVKIAVKKKAKKEEKAAEGAEGAAATPAAEAPAGDKKAAAKK